MGFKLERIRWGVLAHALGVALAAALFVFSALGGLLSPKGHRARCRFCEGPILCQTEDCEADTHSHDLCAEIYEAGVDRGRHRALEHDVDATVEVDAPDA